jgi:hypothetical protein
LQIQSWQHPDLADDEKPGESPCLQHLAAAIAYNDPSRYQCDKATHNTHWSAWIAYE